MSPRVVPDHYSARAGFTVCFRDLGGRRVRFQILLRCVQDSSEYFAILKIGDFREECATDTWRTKEWANLKEIRNSFIIYIVSYALRFTILKIVKRKA